MLNNKRINIENKYEIEQINLIMERIFPFSEQISLFPLLEDCNGNVECIYLNDIIIGFIATLKTNDIIHILYLGIDIPYQRKGYGSIIIKNFLDTTTTTIIADVEDSNQRNISEDEIITRKDREKFYLNSGFQKTGISYNWKNIRYNIFSTKMISRNQYDIFWKENNKLDLIY